jgi:hypothetical protein
MALSRLHRFSGTTQPSTSSSAITNSKPSLSVSYSWTHAAGFKCNFRMLHNMGIFKRTRDFDSRAIDPCTHAICFIDTRTPDMETDDAATRSSPYSTYNHRYSARSTRFSAVRSREYAAKLRTKQSIDPQDKCTSSCERQKATIDAKRPTN